VDRAGALEQPVRQRRFAVIDVRDDAEVARKLNSHGSGHYAGAAAHGQSGTGARDPNPEGRPHFELGKRERRSRSPLPTSLSGTSSGTLLGDSRRRMVKPTDHKQ